MPVASVVTLMWASSLDVFRAEVHIEDMRVRRKIYVEGKPSSQSLNPRLTGAVTVIGRFSGDRLRLCSSVRQPLPSLLDAREQGNGKHSCTARQ
jgi:hypothetical protein